MKNINLLKLDKYNDLSKYEWIKDGIYKDLNDEDSTCYRIALSFELEDGETEQYPLEDLLDQYSMYVVDFLENFNIVEMENTETMYLELAGELADVRSIKNILGKRVYNEYFVKEDAKTYVRLLIE